MHRLMCHAGGLWAGTTLDTKLERAWAPAGLILVPWQQSVSPRAFNPSSSTCSSAAAGPPSMSTPRCLQVGVVVGWSARLHVALLLFLFGSWCAALSVASMFWLSSTYWLAVFVSATMATFVAASVLFLPAVVLLPLIWLYSRIPCLGGRARRRLRLGGIHCERTALVHWAAAAHAGASSALSRLVLGMLLRLLAASDDAALDPPGAVSPLFISAEAGDLAAARTLLAAGADPDHAFWSYLLEGPYHGLNFPLKAAAAGGHREVARELLRADADPNTLDDKGRSAIMEAAARGHSGVLDVLLAFGATPHAADGEGRTPLHLACAGGHARTVELLLRSGVDLDAADRQGVTPLQAAAVGGHAQVGVQGVGGLHAGWQGVLGQGRAQEPHFLGTGLSPALGHSGGAPGGNMDCSWERAPSSSSC